MKKTTDNVTAIDLLNAHGTSLPVKDVKDSTITVVKMAIDEDVDEHGELKDVGYLFADNGNVYGTISGTAIRTIESMIAYVEQGLVTLPVNIKVNMRKSKSDRDFITLQVVE